MTKPRLHAVDVVVGREGSLTTLPIGYCAIDSAAVDDAHAVDIIPRLVVNIRTLSRHREAPSRTTVVERYAARRRSIDQWKRSDSAVATASYAYE